MEEQHRRAHERLQAAHEHGALSGNTVFSFRFFGEMSLTLMEDAHAIITIDATARNLGVVLSANATACRLLGYTRQSLERRNVSAIVPAPWAAYHDGFLRRFLSTGA